MLATIAAAALSMALGCRPPTPEDEYRRALRWTDVDAVRGLLDAGRDPNHRFADGARPLHVVASSKAAKAATARLLIEAGADVNAVDGDGKTAWELRWGRDDRRASEDDAAVLLDPDGVVHEAFGARGECLFLVRPDSHIGFRGQPALEGPLVEYLARIFSAAPPPAEAAS